MKYENKYICIIKYIVYHVAASQLYKSIHDYYWWIKLAYYACFNIKYT